LPERHFSIRDEIKNCENRWSDLCEQFLPVSRADSIWRYSRAQAAAELAQGWKLHVSATVLTAAETLARVAPLLRDSGVHFKAPASLQELRNLNAGLAYGYTQIGKFITVYPASEREAVSLAKRLDKLTARLAAPSVPFDFRYKPKSNVYYRYGAFKQLSVKSPAGSEMQVLRDATGNFVEDARDAENACPPWITNPFPARRASAGKSSSPLDKYFKIFGALTQRGKGGVYQAIDLRRPAEPRLCIVKEGRRNGETDWDGRDGYSRLKQEKFILGKLKKEGVDVPGVFAAFEAKKNYYLVMESLPGATLADLIVSRRRAFSVRRVTEYAVQIARVEDGRVRPFDFEGACFAGEPDCVPWSSPLFMPPEAKKDFVKQSAPAADLFAFGVVLYLLIESRAPEKIEENAVVIRRKIPRSLKQITLDLLHPNPKRRPSAAFVERRLRETL
jgi:hypothetical protein